MPRFTSKRTVGIGRRMLNFGRRTVKCTPKTGGCHVWFLQPGFEALLSPDRKRGHYLAAAMHSITAGDIETQLGAEALPPGPAADGPEPAPAPELELELVPELTPRCVGTTAHRLHSVFGVASLSAGLLVWRSSGAAGRGPRALSRRAATGSLPTSPSRRHCSCSAAKPIRCRCRRRSASAGSGTQTRATATVLPCC